MNVYTLFAFKREQGRITKPTKYIIIHLLFILIWYIFTSSKNVNVLLLKLLSTDNITEYMSVLCSSLFYVSM